MRQGCRFSKESKDIPDKCRRSVHFPRMSTSREKKAPKRFKKKRTLPNPEEKIRDREPRFGIVSFLKVLAQRCARARGENGLLQIHTPGGSARGEQANLTGLVLGCIEAKFCKRNALELGSI